ncbi:maleylacetoacetate isomerase [Thalassospira lucentensis]|uniref:maleylacetoacetate isomerase n=1 Tax=Thalassospira lucentensis TaxID=168935 RepID=UPI00399D6665
MKIFQDKISSAVSRVRIALALKGLDVEVKTVLILGPDAQNHSPEYRRINPQGLVPALLTDEGALLTQSMAIFEYLEERYRDPALLPKDLVARAQARAIALAITSEIHALLPPRVAAKLATLPGIGPTQISEWKHHWITSGMSAVETLLSGHDGHLFAVSDSPTVADIFLFPQAINAERAGIDLGQWPRTAAIIKRLRDIPAFAVNAPAPAS